MIKTRPSQNWLFVLVLLVAHYSLAQNLDGITGVRDSSYTTLAAYTKDVKKHPGIKVVTEFRFNDVKESRNIVYSILGNRKLLLDVFQNTTKSQVPRTAIVIIHGGGWRTGDRTQHYPMAQKLADLDYVCFTPEYRLSTEALFPAAVFDLKAAVRYVRANAVEYHIDPDKIAVLGFSAGGELASFLGVTANMPLFEGNCMGNEQPSTVNAVIDIDGILSFVHPDSGEGNDANGISAATYWFGFPKNDNPVLWETASPLSYVGHKTPPTLFINSSIERMHAGRDDYIAVLDKNRIYSEVHEFKDAPHSFCLYHPWFQPTIAYIDLFLSTVLDK